MIEVIRAYFTRKRWSTFAENQAYKTATYYSAAYFKHFQVGAKLFNSVSVSAKKLFPPRFSSYFLVSHASTLSLSFTMLGIGNDFVI